MRKIILFIGVLFLVMVFTSVQSFSAPDGKGPKPKPWGGSIHVYDANDQFLGYLIKIKDQITHSENYASIFIPSLNLFAGIQQSNAERNAANIYNATTSTAKGKVFFEQPNCVYAPDTTYLTNARYVAQTLYAFSADGDIRYFYSILPEEDILIGLASRLFYGECLEGSYGESGYGYKAVEILEEDIPFTLPVALPLRFELQSK